MSFLAPTLGLGLSGAIGLYGPPAGPGRAGSPAPADVADQIASPILGIFGGADEGIPPSAIEAFDEALELAGVEHRLITYPNAPHSFFDRKAAAFKQESAQSWAEVLEFIRAHT
jgi:carboxymethylenebutenolidase